MSTWYLIPKDDDIMHYGVKGMKWRHRKVGTNESGRKLYERRNNGILVRRPSNTADLVAKPNKVSGGKTNAVSNSGVNGSWMSVIRKAAMGKSVGDSTCKAMANQLQRMGNKERARYINALRNSPKLYKRVMNYYNQRRQIIKKPTQTNNKRVTNTKDPVGSSTGLVGVASRFITNRSRARSGGGGGHH